MDGAVIAPDEVGRGFTTNSEDVVSIPSDAGGVVRMESPMTTGQISVGLPGGQAVRGALVGNSVVYADEAKDTDIAVRVDPEGGPQLLASLSSPSAPQVLSFPLSLPSGANLSANPDGSISILQSFDLADGTTGAIEVGFIHRPWANDAHGDSVNTWYEIDGNTVKQHVVHTEANSYPVVADPHFTVSCGRWACGVRFDRAWTRNARDVAWVATVGAAVCALLTGPAAAGCIAAWGLQTTIIAVYAGRYYETGDCLGLNRLNVGSPFAPFKVPARTANCR